MVNFEFLKISIFLLEEGWFLFLKKKPNENTILFVEKIEIPDFVLNPDFALDPLEITFGRKFAIGSNNVIIYDGSWNEKTVAIKFFNLHTIEKEMKPLIEKEIQILHYLK